MKESGFGAKFSYALRKELSDNEVDVVDAFVPAC